MFFGYAIQIKSDTSAYPRIITRGITYNSISVLIARYKSELHCAQLIDVEHIIIGR